MDGYINCEFDLALAELKTKGLIWLPWVGSRYSRSSRKRLLIVGETHYCNARSSAVARRHIRAHRRDREHTRDCVYDLAVAGKDRVATYENLKRALVGKRDVDGPRFWQGVSYYNFVQREMIRNSHDDERPDGADYYSAWPIFVEVVGVLAPTHCVFIGVEAFASFDAAMRDLGLRFSPVERLDRIGTAYGRSASVCYRGRTITLTGIQHPGKTFSWTQWHSFLSSRYKAGLPCPTC